LSVPTASSRVEALFAANVAAAELRGDGAPEALFPAEADYVRSAVPKRVREFAAGRMCARQAMGRYGISQFVLRAAADRQPLWPDTLVGSISHTTGFCVAVVGRKADWLALGLDTEVVGAPPEEVWSTICGPGDIAWCNALPPDGRAAAVTLVFAAKEAFYKCQYPLTGEWLDFHDLSVVPSEWGPEEGTFLVQQTRPLAVTQFVSAPLEGRYAFHDGLITAGFGLSRGAIRSGRSVSLVVPEDLHHREQDDLDVQHR
jgi:4'-phosphopantetheinyl transferase EntD